MSWKETTVKEERLEFVLKAIAGEESISALCRQYNISRPTGYKWIERYKNHEEMTDRSHATHTKRYSVSKCSEERIVSARLEHPTWGGRKIITYLQGKGYNDLPAPSTATEILRRNNLITPEQSAQHTPYIRFERSASNQLWQMDFKGHFAMCNNQRCHPLTMLDDCSRKLLCLDAYANEQWKNVEKSLLQVFREYGLPDSILSDNGSPWADNENGYTPYEIWMMQLGILPILGRPLHPQTQGKDERFHRTLKEDVLARHPIQDLEDAQRIFDIYRAEYNSERPHAAIHYDVPDKHYTPSKRTLPLNWGEPEYDSGRSLRKVNYKGYLSIQDHRYYLSESFIGKYVELRFCPSDMVDIFYGSFAIARIDLSERLFVSRKIRLPNL